MFAAVFTANHDLAQVLGIVAFIVALIAAVMRAVVPDPAGCLVAVAIALIALGLAFA